MPTCRKQSSHLRFKRRRLSIASVSCLILFSTFFRTRGSRSGTSSPDRISLLFDNSRKLVLDAYNPISAAEPTVPELRMFILGAAVFTTHIPKERSLTVHESSTQGTIVKCRHRRLMPRLVSTNRRCGYGYGQHCAKLTVRKARILSRTCSVVSIGGSPLLIFRGFFARLSTTCCGERLQSGSRDWEMLHKPSALIRKCIASTHHCTNKLSRKL